MTIPVAPAPDTRLAALDAAITRAWRDLTVARNACRANPTGAGVVRIDACENHLNQLLDQRLTLRPPC